MLQIFLPFQEGEVQQLIHPLQVIRHRQAAQSSFIPRGAAVIRSQESVCLDQSVISHAVSFALLTVIVVTRRVVRSSQARQVIEFERQTCNVVPLPAEEDFLNTQRSTRHPCQHTRKMHNSREGEMVRTLAPPHNARCPRLCTSVLWTTPGQS